MKLLLLPLMLAAAPALAAPPFQDVATLDRAVAAFTGRPIGEEGGARAGVDARLKLAACPMVSLAWHGDRRDAVVVTCTGPDWRIFVPVRFAAAGPALPGAAPAPAPAFAAAPRLAAVIRRGDPVTISAGSPGFSITREGIALADAAPGARFLVKCEDARNPVQAVAIESGRATLPGWGE